MPATAQRSYDYEDVIERQFDARDGQTLFLDSDRGSVRVRGDADGEIRVTVVKGVDDVSEREANEWFERFDVAFRETSRGLEIRGENERSRWWRNNRLHVRYEISVPHTFNVDLNTAGGSMHVEDLDGTAELHTSGGSVTANDVGGMLRIRTSGGSITAERIGGRTTLNTSGGSITLSEVDGPAECHTSGGSIRAEAIRGRLDAHTSGGSLRLFDIAGTIDATTSGGSIEAEMTGQPDEDMRLKTSGGSITLRINPDLKADLDAEASGGRIRADVPVMVRGEFDRGRLQGTMNGGGPLLTLRASGGSIRIYPR